MVDMSFDPQTPKSEDGVATCNNLPFAANPLFHGRQDILDEISTALAPDQAVLGARSVAIWGTGGVGKTQIALQFANQQLQAGINAIIWIFSETEAEWSQCFTDAASQLQLPEYQTTNAPSQNRLLVLQWLQKTTSQWVLIFDNVEDDQIFRENWPSTAIYGSILVTCRSESLAASRAAKTIEVSEFSIDESSSLMLKIINRASVDEDEIIASKELCKDLGGLALAVDLIAKQIRLRRKSIRDFIPFYKANSSVLHKAAARSITNPYYRKDLTTVWRAAFDNLSENSFTCLSLLCFVAPESFPDWVLTQPVDLGPTKYAFLQDQIAYDDAILELLDLSLIRIKEKKRHISTHRLIQGAFFDRMSREVQVEALQAMFTLLRKAYPQRTKSSHLYSEWPICEQLSQHVLAWKEWYQKLYEDGYHHIYEDAAILIADVARYFIEIGSFVTGDEILKPLLSQYPEKTTLTYAAICIEAAVLYDRMGRSIPAYDLSKTIYEIRRAHYLGTNPYSNEMANGYSRMSMATTGIWRGDKGLEWIDQAIDCMTQQNASDEEIAKGYNADRYWRNRGRANYQLGRHGDALEDIAQAEKYQLLIHGKDSHYDGESAYMFAKNYYKMQEWEKALRYAQRAYDLMSPGKPNHATVIASRFLQATILIGRGAHTADRGQDDKAALRYLVDALTMCQVNEAQRGNAGESARVKWRMAQIMTRDGRDTEAKLALEAAEETKKSLLSTGEYPTPDDEEESWNALVGLLYR